MPAGEGGAAVCASAEVICRSRLLAAALTDRPRLIFAFCGGHG